MNYMKIKCHSCENDWTVYDRDNWKADTARTCPNCHRQIDRQTWHNSILSAFGAAMDASRVLQNDHTGYCQPLFSVDFRTK